VQKPHLSAVPVFCRCSRDETHRRARECTSTPDVPTGAPFFAVQYSRGTPCGSALSDVPNETGGLCFPLILKLPETGLPALEELEITHCSMELTEQCRKLALATSQPRVKINYEYVN